MGECEKALFLLPENQGELTFSALPLVINHSDLLVFPAPKAMAPLDMLFYML